MPDRIETENAYGRGVVLNWASIIDPNAMAQAEMTSRSPVVAGHVALMPDAHLGLGATIGSVVLTRNAIIPAAVGVDIGCGMNAVHFDFPYANLPPGSHGALAAALRAGIPNGVGQNHHEFTWRWEDWVQDNGYAPSMEIGRPLDVLDERAGLQFGTLGSGNHFAEFSVDEAGDVWAIVHSGSRGTGNKIAQHHIDIAKAECAERGLESLDLAYLRAGTDTFDAYIADMLWAQRYAAGQRDAMMGVMVDAMASVVDERYGVEVLDAINCHHNYAFQLGHSDRWLTRKGAIAAAPGVMGVIPGSMGTDTYIVTGLGNADSYDSAPHGAGRVHSRGAARRSLSLDDFRATMTGKTWDDRNAEALLDEAPAAYKPIETVMSDADDLVRPVARLQSFVNFKAADGKRRKK